MAQEPYLDLKVQQKLLMTQSLKQAISLLQMNNLELSAFLETELQNNPFLEKEGEGEFEREPQEDKNEAENAEPREDTEDEAPLDVDIDNDFTNDAWNDSPYDDRTPASSSSTSSSSSSDSVSPLDFLEAPPQTLRDSVLEQIEISFRDPREKFFARFLLNHLSDAGYLEIPLDEAARKLNVPDDEARAVIETLQTFSPTGIFCRSLKECLSLQLQEKELLTPAMALLLDNLELIQKREYKTLEKICAVPRGELDGMIGKIRLLDPKPGAVLSQTPADPVIPDVLVYRTKTGDYRIELNQSTLPRVLISEQYQALLKKTPEHDKEARRFLKPLFSSASFLVKAMAQRAETILKVSTEIFTRQRGFLESGISQLKPMTLKDISETLSIHESTVSRVTAGKYAATPRGCFELKYFFSSALSSETGGQDHSSEAIRHRIKTLIDEEKSDFILSDDDLSAILKREGITVARRTVAKYREQIGCPTSAQRKREKR